MYDHTTKLLSILKVYYAKVYYFIGAMPQNQNNLANSRGLLDFLL